MKTLTSVLFVLCPTLLLAAPPDSAVYVRHELGGEADVGSGTVVAYENNKSLILTAAHVTFNGTGTYTIILNGKKYDAKYLYASPVKVIPLPGGQLTMEVEGVDLALLTVDKELPTVKIATQPLKEGDKVSQWGFSGGRLKNGPFQKVGRVTDVEAVWTTADARRGDSGCGLFNKSGELAGVVHSRPIDQNEPAGLAVPLQDIKKFLVEHAKGFPNLQKSLKE